jgi:mRNA interferase YafQ
MRNLELSHRFKKDLKKFKHNKAVKEAFNVVLKLLVNAEKLPEKYLDHPLSGDYTGCRECHVKPDILLVYWTDDKIVYLARFGSHSELF